MNSSEFCLRFEALKIARRERGLDLVRSLAHRPATRHCRIQDYGKFLYEKDKEA